MSLNDHLHYSNKIKKGRRKVLTMDFILLMKLSTEVKRERLEKVKGLFVKSIDSASGRLDSSRTRYVEVQLASVQNEGGSWLLYFGVCAEGVCANAGLRYCESIGTCH